MKSLPRSLWPSIFGSCILQNMAGEATFIEHNSSAYEDSTPYTDIYQWFWDSSIFNHLLIWSIQRCQHISNSQNSGADSERCSRETARRNLDGVLWCHQRGWWWICMSHVLMRHSIDPFLCFLTDACPSWLLWVISGDDSGEREFHHRWDRKRSPQVNAHRFCHVL